VLGESAKRRRGANRRSADPAEEAVSGDVDRLCRIEGVACTRAYVLIGMLTRALGADRSPFGDWPTVVVSIPRQASCRIGVGRVRVFPAQWPPRIRHFCL